MKKLLTALAAVLPLALLAPAAHAQIDPLTVSLTPEGGASLLPGGTLVYDATFTNTTGADYLIDNATFSVPDSQTLSLFTPLFTGPYTAGVGTTTLLDVFELTADPSLAPQTDVVGDVSFSGAPLAGGLPTGPDVEAASIPVQFQIASASAPVPEASTAASSGLGVLVLVGLALKARRRSAALPSSDNG